MEIGLMIIFWYGILHAFGPDHLTAIADFSIGKEAKKTFAIVSAFAVGHGMMLFMFAKLLQHFSRRIPGLSTGFHLPDGAAKPGEELLPYQDPPERWLRFF